MKSDTSTKQRLLFLRLTPARSIEPGCWLQHKRKAECTFPAGLNSIESLFPVEYSRVYDVSRLRRVNFRIWRQLGSQSVLGCSVSLVGRIGVGQLLPAVSRHQTLVVGDLLAAAGYLQLDHRASRARRASRPQSLSHPACGAVFEHLLCLFLVMPVGHRRPHLRPVYSLS